MWKPLLTIILFFVIAHEAEAQYADLGTGTLKDQIWWFDWNNFEIANGAFKTFNTTDGLEVTIRFKDVGAEVPYASVMNTWSGAVLHNLYDFSNPDILPALYTGYTYANVSFTIEITVSRNAILVPFTFIAADAEACDANESIVLHTDGSPWQTVDFFRNSTQRINPLSGCNTNEVTVSNTYAGSANLGQNPVIATVGSAVQPMNVSVSFNRNVWGASGVTFGILEPVDRGDLPESYGYAQHALSYINTNPCNYLPPLPGRIQSEDLKLGDVVGDADGVQTSDDNTNGNDEESVAGFNKYDGSGTYTINVNLHNATGKNAVLTGWFDYNRNGIFDNAESKAVVIPPNTTSAKITWTNLPARLPIGSVSLCGFRIRLSTDNSAVQTPTGFAKDGEVEDYLTDIVKEEIPIVIPEFTAPDTVCVNTPIQIKNSTSGAASYYWSFCTADINQTPVGDNLGNLDGSFHLPVYSDIINVNGNYYVFVSNNHPGGLVRLDYGNSLLNNPTVVNLGNLGVINDNTEGVQVVKDDDKYYAIIVGGDEVNGNTTPYIIKIDFGGDITNAAPVATNWGDLGDMSYPHDLYIFNQDGTWYGFTTNFYTSTITKFDFGTGFNSPPAATNLGNIGNLSSPVGVYAVNDEGKYHVFITNAGSNTLSRLDFGSSLLNTPVPVNLGNLNNTFHSCWDIYVIKYCNEIKGFVINGDDNYNDIVSLSFPNNDITSAPQAQSLGNIGNLSFPHSISKLFRAGPDIYSFIPNAHNNTLTRIKFSGCTASSIASSAKQNPPVFSYAAPGNYNITLSVDDGLATQSSACRQIVILAPPDQRPTIDTGFCKSSIINLVSFSTGANYLWNTGDAGNNINVSEAGKYWVTVDNYGCKSTDSFNVSKNEQPLVALGNDTALCEADSLIVYAKNTGSSYLWQDGSVLDNLKINTAGVYSVQVTNKSGCIARDTIIVTQLASPILSGLSDKVICKGDKTQLSITASGDSNSYIWQPNPTLSATDIADPIALPDDTTRYFISVKSTKGCITKDSVQVNVLARPVVSIRSDTTICSGTTIPLTTSSANASVFTWSPSANLSNDHVANPDAAPLSGTTYSLSAGNGVCSTADEVTVNVIRSPLVTAGNDTTICGTVTAQLSATGASMYAWYPSNGLNNIAIQNPVASPLQTTVYHVKGIGSNGCINEDSVKVAVAALPVFAIDPPKAGVCKGDSILVKASGGDTYIWNTTPDILQPDNAETYIKPSGNLNYTVTVTNNTCKVTNALTTSLFINPDPVIRAASSNDIDCAINTTTLRASGGTTYSWTPAATLLNANTASPVAMPSQATTYYVKVRDSKGCVGVDSVTVKVSFGNLVNGYLMASAFTPNYDGINDCFGVKKWSIVNNLDFSVYDRWGVLLFHSNNTNDCWDGNYKGVQEPGGTYVYQIRAKTFCGDIYRKGTFVLIR